MGDATHYQSVLIVPTVSRVAACGAGERAVAVVVIAVEGLPTALDFEAADEGVDVGLARIPREGDCQVAPTVCRAHHFLNERFVVPACQRVDIQVAPARSLR